jgi:hypothetical protein
MTEGTQELTSLLDAPQGTTQGATEGGSLLDTAGAPAAPPTAPEKGTQQTEGNAQKVEGNTDQKQEQKPNQAPESYADFKLPEGIAADKAMTEEFKSIAKSLNLSQENAQKLVDVQAKYVKSQGDAVLNQYKQQVENWKKESIQSLGADYKKELSLAAKARDRFGSPELKQLLNDTGLANHKDVISLFLKVGKAISEDGFVDGNKRNQPKSDAEIFYPTMTK